MDNNDKIALDAFTIQPNRQTALMGAFVGSYAIKDSLSFLAIGIGCKAKLTITMGYHENNDQDYTSRMGWAEFQEHNYIMGNLDTIQRNIDGQLQRIPAKFIPVISSPVVKTIGLSIKEEVERIQQKINIPIKYIPLSSVESDFWEGYNEVSFAFAQTLNWKTKVQKNTAVIWGFPFDRYEQDHIASVEEIKKLALFAGITIKAIFLSGTSTEELRKAETAEYNIILPHASPIGNRIKKMTGKKTIYCDLPVGLIGTKKWIERLQAITGKKERNFEKEIVSREHIRLHHVQRNKGKKVSLVLDVPWIGCLGSLLQEIGYDIQHVVARNKTYFGDKKKIQSILNYHNISANSVHFDGILDGIRYINREKPDFVVSTSNEEMFFESIPCFNFGFPSYNRHCTAEPAPYIGFKGFDYIIQEIEKVQK
jgi:nitrogenase molybdenum-iron protein alpha/beta subunit